MTKQWKEAAMRYAAPPMGWNVVAKNLSVRGSQNEFGGISRGF
ncbi:MAG: hypothetical protein QNJ60_12980 [Xenococcaceae cyanobacterium MO_188.B19]|nr:hypothetical protein [Xenococcaceae cyanobacterium MO_188.B19]